MCRRTLILKLLHSAILSHGSFAEPELAGYGGHRPARRGKLVNLLVQCELPASLVTERPWLGNAPAALGWWRK